MIRHKEEDLAAIREAVELPKQGVQGELARKELSRHRIERNASKKSVIYSVRILSLAAEDRRGLFRYIE